MDYILRYPLNSDDIDFLNMTSIQYDVHNTRSIGPVDSGWCDMATQARIINDKDRVIFKDVSDSELTFLNLKYGDRLRLLHSGLREIYNIAERHNAPPEAVIDSPGDA